MKTFLKSIIWLAFVLTTGVLRGQIEAPPLAPNPALSPGLTPNYAPTLSPSVTPTPRPELRTAESYNRSFADRRSFAADDAGYEPGCRAPALNASAIANVNASDHFAADDDQTAEAPPPTEIELLQAKLKETREQSKKYATFASRAADQLKQLRDEEKRDRGLEAIAGLTNAIGELLRKQRLELPDVRKFRGRRDALQGRISDVQLDIFKTEERHSQVEKELCNKVLSPANRETLAALKPALDELLAEQSSYFHQLVEHDTAESDLAQATLEFTDYIDQRVLWIRSTTPVWKADPRSGIDAGRWLIDPKNWRSVGDDLLKDATDHPGIAALFVLIFGPLLFWQRRLRREVTLLGEIAGHSLRIWPTLMTVFLTMVIAAIWPALMAYSGWRVSQNLDNDFARALSAGLIAGAIAFYPVECIRQLCRGGGLAAAHFHWPVETLRLIRRQLRWLALLSLPLLLTAAMFQQQPVEAWSSTLGRAGFIVALVLAAIALSRALRSESPIWHGAKNREPHWWDRLKTVWTMAAMCIPLAIAVLAATGYYYTAWRLAWRVQASFWLIVGMFSLRELLVRWVLLARKRLMLKQPLSIGMRTADGHVLESDDEDIHPDVVQISEQTSRLMHSLVVLGILGGIIAIWADVLPALNFLNRVELWTDTDTKLTVTLANVLLSIMITAVTWIAVRNLPGLLEIVVLQRLPLDAAGRYAINAVSRYLIVIFGMLSAFSAIGVGWAKVQWLAAAVTVGLGFGLQEIFANFISGLIILFERPMRMGDVITTGGISGVVTKIRMRATTIVDSDRKELIVPNKEFITGRLQNWTLSDQILRTVVPISLAFESDVATALKIMLDAAQKHPNVMQDPGPQAALVSFNNSALNFELRVHTPGVGVMGGVQHDLHTTIHDSLLKANIQLARSLNDTRVTTFPESSNGKSGGSTHIKMAG